MDEKEQEFIVNEHTGRRMLTEEINDIKHGVLDCSGEEYAKQVGAVNINDIQWTKM